MDFYDNLAADYHQIYADWNQAIQRQAAALHGLIGTVSRVLDCTAGIGTQSLGLAGLGHAVRAADISSASLLRLTQEAKARGLDIPTTQADIRVLADHVHETFDVVLACDNALPHLLSDDDLHQALSQMRKVTRPGGLAIVSLRDYGPWLAERQSALPPAVHRTSAGLRIVNQVWDWDADGPCYTLHLLITTEADGWRTVHHSTRYRALRVEELAAAMSQAGWSNVHLRLPTDTGFFQPIYTATADGGQ